MPSKSKVASVNVMPRAENFQVYAHGLASEVGNALKLVCELEASLQRLRVMLPKDTQSARLLGNSGKSGGLPSEELRGDIQEIAAELIGKGLVEPFFNPGKEATPGRGVVCASCGSPKAAWEKA